MSLFAAAELEELRRALGMEERDNGYPEEDS